MAHFAKLGPGNVVEQVIVVDNRDTADANGVEKEYIGAAFCEKLFGGTWKQTSYNGNKRKNYAEWKAPVDMPTDGQMYSWDEATTSWIATEV
jgi:hypothetical protein